MTLDDEDVDAIARRMVELLDERVERRSALVDAVELARVLDIDAVWVRQHAQLLGGIRLGDGPRARLRFDVADALERLRARDELAARGPALPPRDPTRASDHARPAIRRRRSRRRAA